MNVEFHYDFGSPNAYLAHLVIPAIERRTGVAFLASDLGVKQELIDNTERSVARGTFGSPTFFVGDEIFFGKDRLREVEEEIRAHRDRAGEESR